MPSNDGYGVVIGTLHRRVGNACQKLSNRIASAQRTCLRKNGDRVEMVFDK